MSDEASETPEIELLRQMADSLASLHEKLDAFKARADELERNPGAYVKAAIATKARQAWKGLG